MFGRPAVRDQIISWVDTAIGVQDGAVRAHVEGVRACNPAATGDVVQALEGQYLATTSGAGAAVGGAASIPGIGTTFAVGLSVAETVAFLDATALFAFATAHAHGHDVGDMPRRRAMFLGALLGDDALALVPGGEGGRDGWGARLVALDDVAVADLNRTLEKWLLTRFGPRQGMLVLGRLAPFGIGAAVGAAGNALTAKGVIARVRSAFAGVVPTGPAAVALGEPAPAATDTATDTATEADAEDADATAPATPAEATGPLPTPPVGKYLPLHEFLAARAGGTVELTFDEVGAALVGGLPAAARRNASWWGNDPSPRAPQARAWLAAGLHVADVDLAAATVRLVPAPAVVLHG